MAISGFSQPPPPLPGACSSMSERPPEAARLLGFRLTAAPEAMLAPEATALEAGSCGAPPEPCRDIRPPLWALPGPLPLSSVLVRRAWRTKKDSRLEAL